MHEKQLKPEAPNSAKKRTLFNSLHKAPIRSIPSIIPAPLGRSPVGCKHSPSVQAANNTQAIRVSSGGRQRPQSPEEASNGGSWTVGDTKHHFGAEMAVRQISRAKIPRFLGSAILRQGVGEHAIK
jgi:hypothetical protein